MYAKIHEIIEESHNFNYANPDKFGPGLWYVLHSIAYECKQGNVDLKFLNLLFRHISTYLPCMECRNHFSENIREVSDKNEAFSYLFRFHNAVTNRISNERGINIPTPKFETVYKWYSEREVEYIDLKGGIKEPFDRIGPGCWWALHSTALHMPSLFNVIIRMFANRYPCKDCRIHINKQLYSNSLESVINLSAKDQNKRIFEWTYSFHNLVNGRLGKKMAIFSEVYDYFSNNKGCEEDCRNTGNDINNSNGKRIRKNIVVV